MSWPAVGIFWTVAPVPYQLAIPYVCFQRSDLDQPDLTDLDAFKVTVSQKASKVLDVIA